MDAAEHVSDPVVSTQSPEYEGDPVSVQKSSRTPGAEPPDTNGAFEGASGGVGGHCVVPEEADEQVLPQRFLVFTKQSYAVFGVGRSTTLPSREVTFSPPTPTAELEGHVPGWMVQ